MFECHDALVHAIDHDGVSDAAKAKTTKDKQEEVKRFHKLKRYGFSPQPVERFHGIDLRNVRNRDAVIADESMLVEKVHRFHLGAEG